MKNLLLMILLLGACLANALAAEPLRLVRFGPPGEERPGVLDADGRVRDLSGVVADPEIQSLGRQRQRISPPLPDGGGAGPR